MTSTPHPRPAWLPLNALRRLAENPVIVKEVRTRMRGGRAFTVVTVHLAALGLILALAYLVFSASLTTSTSLEERRTLGKLMFGLLVGMELTMISFTAPALTSGAIASEHERQTYDLIKVSLLPARALVLGKYLSGLSFVLLLIFTALPMLGPAYLIGGLLPQEVIIAVLVLLMTAVSFCAAGMFFSSLTRRTLFATVLSYAYAILSVFGVPVMALFLLIIFSARLNTSVTDLSPLVEALLIFSAWLVIATNPGASLVASEIGLLDGQGIWSATLNLGQNRQVWVISPWIAYLVLNLLFSLLLLWLTEQRARQVER
ncbi:MAG: ABC transporter permease [Chloroflexota bacterium]